VWIFGIDFCIIIAISLLAFNQGFNNIAVLHGGLLRFASKFEPEITAAAGEAPRQQPACQLRMLLTLGCSVNCG
jgi:hypothetical protein